MDNQSFKEADPTILKPQKGTFDAETLQSHTHLLSLQLFQWAQKVHHFRNNWNSGRIAAYNYITYEL